MKVVDTDVLVVGAGPAGLTAAAFLARYGVGAITVSKYEGTADSPRAHITNQRTVEVFRDLGIEQEVMDVAMPQHLMGTQVFATSFAGSELCRMMSFGAGLDRRDEYAAASPCGNCNAPQHILEPLILKGARRHRADIRFGQELISLSQDAGRVHAKIRKRDNGDEYAVRARFVIGADGARSVVAEQAAFEIEGDTGLGDAFTVWLEADLTRFARHRSGALFFVCEPGSDIWLSAWTCVKPWTEWNPLFVQHGLTPANLSEEAVLARVRAAIGDPSVPVKIKKISTWQINRLVASRYRIGRVFLAGDAAHRHPPSNGLGSNTSIQDAYNISWKLALVLRGQAGDALLDTYNDERQPIGRQIVDRAIQSIGDMQPWSDALGLRPNQSIAEASANIEELFGHSPAGARRRDALLKGLDRMNWQFNTLGVEMGQRYERGALVSDGTPFPAADRDLELHYQPTTHPGACLPHVWLEHQRKRISTLDLPGQGGFALITGVGGGAWLDAAAEVTEALGVPVKGCCVGMRQSYDDVLGEWTRCREVLDDGCVLVRPDRFVAWRSHGTVTDPTSALLEAMRRILARS